MVMGHSNYYKNKDFRWMLASSWTPGDVLESGQLKGPLLPIHHSGNIKFQNTLTLEATREDAPACWKKLFVTQGRASSAVLIFQTKIETCTSNSFILLKTNSLLYLPIFYLTSFWCILFGNVAI